MQSTKPKVFISCSEEDKPLARHLENELMAAGAEEVWVAHLPGGVNWPEAISNALNQSNVLLLIWSQTGSNSYWVKQEWTNAVSLKKDIIPCLRDNTPLPCLLANKVHID